jgi:hypothetical protein
MNKSLVKSILAIITFCLSWFLLFSYFFNANVKNGYFSEKENQVFGQSKNIYQNYYDDSNYDRQEYVDREVDNGEIIIDSARVIKTDGDFVFFYAPEQIVYTKGNRGSLQKMTGGLSYRISAGSIGEIIVRENRVTGYTYEELLLFKEGIIISTPSLISSRVLRIEASDFEKNSTEEIIVLVPFDAIIEDDAGVIDYSTLEIGQKIRFSLDTYFFAGDKKNISMYIKVIK